MNVAFILKQMARQFPDKAALIFKEETLSYSQLKDAAFQFANALKRLGIKKGDALAVYLPNCPPYLIFYFAVYALGAVIVPLDFYLTQDELLSCLSHCQAKLLFWMPKPEFLAEELKKDLPHLKHLICLGAGSKKSLNFTELVAQESMDFAPLEIKDEDISTIFYTSGTTGTPKGAPLNYLQLNAPPLALKYFVNLSAQDINLCTIPLSHSGGWVCTLFSITAGMTLVLMERFNPLEFLRHIEKHKVTCFLLVPSMYLAILQLKEFEKFDLTSLRWVTVFGAPSSPEMLRRFHQYCPQADFFNGWGMTETCPPTTVLPLDRLNKLESVGKPVPWVEIKVVNDEGREMANGEIGEIICRGWPVAKGYFKDEKLTQEAIRDGWLYSGDLGTFDEEGLLYVVGRKKDMIKVAGQIVFAHEIEAALEKHPQLAEVAVVGIKDKLRGEVPKVFIVPKPGEEIGEQAVRDFCRQHLAHFKIPQAIEFRDSLPKTRSGKIQKEILKMGE